jgi:hypothetical protein
MRTAAIMCCGSYYSPWTPYTIASVYRIVDFLVITNAGFDLRSPSFHENDIPLREVTRDIERLDVEGKIIEVTDVSRLKRKLPLMSQRVANELRINQWYDLRGRNMTLASEVAYDEGAKMVLRIDTDQVCYRDALNLRGRPDALILYQYEFQGDIYHLADPGPSSPFNDSTYYYPISKDDWYVGGLAPVIRENRKECHDMHCAHLRGANPIDLSEEKKYRHFRDRFLFHLWTNEYAEFTDELFKRADREAKEALKRRGKPSNVPPPEVTLTRPRSYIEEITA